MVIGLLVISITAFAGSFADRNQREPEVIADQPSISVTEEPEETPTIAPTETPIATPTEELIVTPTDVPTSTPTSEPTPTSMIFSRDWDADDAYLLAKIAMAEAEDQDTEGKALVICVVLNRAWSKIFPNSIKEVLYQPNQFSPISNGRFDRVEPNEDCWKALEMVELGWDESQGALYFESESASTWHRDHLKYLFKHGDHIFYTERE